MKLTSQENQINYTRMRSKLRVNSKLHCNLFLHFTYRTGGSHTHRHLRSELRGRRTVDSHGGSDELPWLWWQDWPRPQQLTEALAEEEEEEAQKPEDT